MNDSPEKQRLPITYFGKVVGTAIIRHDGRIDGIIEDPEFAKRLQTPRDLESMSFAPTKINDKSFKEWVESLGARIVDE